MRGRYKDFLRSPYWRALRRQVIALHPFCEKCECHNNLQVHHTSYSCLGTKEEYYRYRNLKVLCRTCHAEEHGLPAEERDWRGPEHISTILADVLRQIPRRVA